MNIYINNQRVASSLLTVKKKVKKVSGIASGSIIEIRYPKGKSIKYLIVTKSVDTKKTKGLTKVNFKLVK